MGDVYISIANYGKYIYVWVKCMGFGWMFKNRTGTGEMWNFAHSMAI